MIDPEAALIAACQGGSQDLKRLPAWLELFLKLAQPRIDGLLTGLRLWLHSPDPLGFSVLSLADELAGICAEQHSPAMSELASTLFHALQRASAHPPAPRQREALLAAAQELYRQMHQHAAGVEVLTPASILSALELQPHPH